MGECQECSERGEIHGDGAADRIEALFRQEGRINTFRMGQKYFVAQSSGIESVETEGVAVWA